MFYTDCIKTTVPACHFSESYLGQILWGVSYLVIGIVVIFCVSLILILAILVIGIVFTYFNYIMEGIVKTYQQADAIFLDSLTKKRHTH
jgi:hypothetical protein